MQVARQVAQHLKLFDLVLASDGVTNLSGEVKSARLVRELGRKASITPAMGGAIWRFGLPRVKRFW